MDNNKNNDKIFHIDLGEELEMIAGFKMIDGREYLNTSYKHGEHGKVVKFTINELIHKE